LAEYLTYDHQFNSLARKVAYHKGIPYSKLEDSFDYISKNFTFSLIPYFVHSYNKNGEYHNIDKARKSIIAEEKILIKKFHPPLN